MQENKRFAGFKAILAQTRTDQAKRICRIALIAVCVLAILLYLLFSSCNKSSYGSFSKPANDATQTESSKSLEIVAAESDSKVAGKSLPAEFDPDISSGISDIMQGQQIVVFVSGAVQNPGVYKLNPGERIGDAVNLAGGIREDGADDYVNLAAQVKDGQQIKIPTIEEARNLIARGEGDGFGVGTGDGTDTANAGAAAGGVNDSMATGTSRNIPAVNAKVNINTANASSLQTLNGIGPATAQKIIEYRNTHGAFTSIEALKQVSGIGEKKFAAIADMICV